jgi:hypothetical protein
MTDGGEVMWTSELVHVGFAIGVFHAVCLSVYCYGIRRDADWDPSRQVLALARRTRRASLGLVVAYLVIAFIGLQALPVEAHYQLFMASWTIYGALLGGLLALSLFQAYRIKGTRSPAPPAE